MKRLLLVVLVAAAATAAVVSNEEPDLVEVSDMADGDKFADEDLTEIDDVSVPDDVSELDDLSELADMSELNDGSELDDESELDDVSELSDEAHWQTETAIDSRRSLSLGTIGCSKLRYNKSIKANGIANRPRVWDATIRLGKPITAIRVTRLGSSMKATPSIRNGGLGKTSVTIRIRSAAGCGFHYRIKVYTK